MGFHELLQGELYFLHHNICLSILSFLESRHFHPHSCHNTSVPSQYSKTAEFFHTSPHFPMQFFYVYYVCVSGFKGASISTTLRALLRMLMQASFSLSAGKAALREYLDHP
jgi:energy-converting hydrogenase Eha subunit G